MSTNYSVYDHGVLLRTEEIHPGNIRFYFDKGGQIFPSKKRCRIELCTGKKVDWDFGSCLELMNSVGGRFKLVAEYWASYSLPVYTFIEVKVSEIQLEQEKEAEEYVSLRESPEVKRYLELQQLFTECVSLRETSEVKRYLELEKLLKLRTFVTEYEITN